jgi:hypothetical protein
LNFFVERTVLMLFFMLLLVAVAITLSSGPVYYLTNEMGLCVTIRNLICRQQCL